MHSHERLLVAIRNQCDLGFTFATAGVLCAFVIP